MSMTSATTLAAQILSNTLAVLMTVREQAQTSKDAELKNRISTLYDSVLELKEAVMLVTDENNQLRHRIAELEKPPERPVIKQVGTTNYYFLGDGGPFCQPCYDVKGKLVSLMPVQDYAGGSGRKCEVCKTVFFEGPRRSREEFDDNAGDSDPLGWMGR